VKRDSSVSGKDGAEMAVSTAAISVAIYVGVGQSEGEAISVGEEGQSDGELTSTTSIGEVTGAHVTRLEVLASHVGRGLAGDGGDIVLVGEDTCVEFLIRKGLVIGGTWVADMGRCVPLFPRGESRPFAIKK
jgi:hypothetical protein